MPDLSVAAEALGDPEEVKKYFGTNLRGVL